VRRNSVPLEPIVADGAGGLAEAWVRNSAKVIFVLLHEQEYAHSSRRGAQATTRTAGYQRVKGASSPDRPARASPARAWPSAWSIDQAWTSLRWLSAIMRLRPNLWRDLVMAKHVVAKLCHEAPP